MKQFFKKVTLAFCSLFFFLFLIEFGFKVVAFIQPNQTGASSIKGLPYENTPNASFWRFDKEVGFNHYRHNQFGMRGRDTTVEKPDGVLRIAMLGDSVLHGGNVSQDETTPVLLEKFLNRRHPDPKRRRGEGSHSSIEVLNFGVASYGLPEYVIQLREKVSQFKPDIVMLGMCLNDYVVRSEEATRAVEKNTKRSRLRERFQNLLKSHFYEFLKKTSNVDKLFSRRKKHVEIEEDLNKIKSIPNLSPKNARALIQYGRTNHIPLNVVSDIVRGYTDPIVWEEGRSYFKKIAKLSKDMGAKLIVFAYPLGEQIWPGYEHLLPQTQIKDIVTQLGATYIPLLESFRGYQRQHPHEKIFPTYDNMHMFKNGHRFVAQQLARRLVIPEVR